MNRFSFLSDTWFLRAAGAGAGAATSPPPPPPPPSPPPGGTGAAAGDGGAKPYEGPWWGDPGLKLDDETKGFWEGKGAPDLSTALRSGMHAEKLARERNALPKPDPKNIAEWEGWKELGWPEKPEDYKLARPELKPGVEYDANLESAFAKAAHAARVPLPAAQAILNETVGYLAKQVEDATAAGATKQQELDRALRETWGDKYEANKELATRAARHFGLGAEDGAELERVVGSPRLMGLFHRLGEALGEDNLVMPSGGAGGFGANPGRARTELNRMEADAEQVRALQDVRHPRHEEVRARRERLQRELAGG